mgnify:CR=1 FL=1
MYLWNDMVHSSESDVQTRSPLEMNQGRGGMRRLMEEAEAEHVEVVHYSASARILVGSGVSTDKDKEIGFWLIVVGSFSV